MGFGIAELVVILIVAGVLITTVPKVFRRLSAFESSLIIDHKRRVAEDAFLRGEVSNSHHLQEQIDGMQLEIERLTERLDFTERLLENRPPPDALPPSDPEPSD